MPSGASVVRASVAVLLDQPFGVVAGGEGADGVSDVVDGLEDTSVHDLLLEGSEQALDDAIGLRLSDEGVARRDAPGADLFLESVRHEVAAVIMPQRQAAGGAGVDAVELVSHRHADGLKSFEAGPALGDMPTEQLGVPVLGDARSVLFIAFATPAAGVFFFRMDFELAQILFSPRFADRRRLFRLDRPWGESRCHGRTGDRRPAYG